MTVGVYEAKTHLPALLDRVAKGESITITRHGVPIARLLPVERARTTADIQAAIEGLKAFRKRHRLRGLSIRAMINEGRR